MSRKGQVPWNKGLKKSAKHRAAIKAGMNNETVKNKIRQSRKRFIDEVMPSMTKEQRRIWGSPGKANPMYGRKHSEETKQKMSRNRSGLDSWWQGRKRSPEQCQQISRIRKQWWRDVGSKWNMQQRKIWGTPGSDHPNWRGGKIAGCYPSGWTNIFKEQIRSRDAYECQLCGKPEVENKRRLDVHHIDYNKDNLNPMNLISLCMSCHRRTGGNRNYWRSYFTKGLYAENIAGALSDVG